MKAAGAILACLAIASFPARAHSQTFDNLLESYLEAEVPDLAELLESLIPEPIRINRITPDSLYGLWFLDEEQITALVRLHRSKAPHISYADLQVATELPEEVLKVIFSLEGFPLRYRLRGRIRGQDLGVAQDWRITAEGRRWRFGALAEKDAGEQQFADFFASYFRYTWDEPGLSILLGDFTVQHAVGLLFAGPYGQTPLTLPENPIRETATRLIPFHTISENAAFRGSAVSWNGQKFSLLGFISSVGRDAVVSADRLVTSMPVDGDHSSAAGRNARDALRQKTLGGATSFVPLQNLRLGVACMYEFYEPGLASPDSMRRHFAFRGRTKTIFSSNFSYRSADGSLRTFGEIARMRSGMAGIWVLRRNFRRVNITLAGWSADPEYNNLHGALPGEYLGETDNASAIYAGLTARSALGRSSFYIMRRATPWRTYFLPVRTRGQEVAADWRKRIRSKTYLRLRLTFRDSPEMGNIESLRQQAPGKALTSRRQLSWRAEIQAAASRRVRYRLRLDGTRVYGLAGGMLTGLAQMHELRAAWPGKFRFTLRYTFFKSESFDSRLYGFEYRLPGYSQPVPLYGSGERIFVNAFLRLGSHAQFAAYIVGESKTDQRAQIRFGLQIQYF